MGLSAQLSGQKNWRRGPAGQGGAPRVPQDIYAGSLGLTEKAIYLKQPTVMKNPLGGPFPALQPFSLSSRPRNLTLLVILHFCVLFLFLSHTCQCSKVTSDSAQKSLLAGLGNCCIKPLGWTWMVVDAWRCLSLPSQATWLCNPLQPVGIWVQESGG